MHEFGGGGHDHSDLEMESFLNKIDNVELTTIGVDVGSATFHLMFARIYLHRETQNLSTRFAVVKREVLWRSEIGRTPYAGKRIDATAIADFVQSCHEAAGIRPEEIDSGAVILTGEALRQHNARAIGEGIAAGSGKFVCVSAGHHLESMLAGYGSGATEYTKTTGSRLLHIDIGGGTTKLSTIIDGQVCATAAVMVGGRQIAWDADRRIISTTAGASTIARAAGIDLAVGTHLSVADEQLFLAEQVKIILAIANQAAAPLERRLRLTRVLPKGFTPDAVSFSGGVSEYIYGREAGEYGDLGPGLGRALRQAIADGLVSLPVVNPGEGIRATVVGASQSTVRLSGNTLTISDHGVLPIHNVPVVRPAMRVWTESEPLDPEELNLAIREAVAKYGLHLDDPLAISLSWHGDPSHREMARLADGVQRALAAEGASPVIIMMDDDIAASIGRIIISEFPLQRPLISLDGLDFSPLDHVDVGAVLEPSGAVPVVIKSLLFGADQ